MHKIYREFWSKEELDDLSKVIITRDDWSVSGTISRGQIKDKKEELSSDYYNMKARSRISQSQTKPPIDIQVHFKNKLLKVMDRDFPMENDSYYFDEEWAIQRYQGIQGGKFDWHQDVLDFFKYVSGDSAEQHFIKNTRPHRRLSVSVAMNDKSDYNEGNLVVGTLDEKSERVPVDLDRGDMVIFTSDTWHGVEPVTEGIRYALIIWALSYNEIIEWNQHYKDLEDNTETTL